jgi:hypothetical protein
MDLPPLFLGYLKRFAGAKPHHGSSMYVYGPVLQAALVPSSYCWLVADGRCWFVMREE